MLSHSLRAALLDERYKQDPVSWVHDHELLPNNPDGTLGKLDEWQQQVLTTSIKRVILNCSRQSGKSTIASLLALWTALYKPGSLILIVSPGFRQSIELFKKVTDAYRKLDSAPELIEDNKLSCIFENHSRIVALPGIETTIRGYSSPTLIIEDESARVPDEIHEAIVPMLAVSQGQLILMSTPFGEGNHFYEIWSHAEGWLKVKIPASSCPRISEEYLQEQREAPHGSSFYYAQEFLCEFVAAEGSLFTRAQIEELYNDPSIKPLWPGES